MSKEMNNFISSLNISHLKVALYSPSSNGLVERANRILKEGIQTALSARLDVAEFLNDKIWSYLTTPHSTTVVPPFTCLRGREAKSKLIPGWLKIVSSQVNPQQMLSHSAISQTVLEKQGKPKSWYDRKHKVHPIVIKENYFVLIKKPQKIVKGESKYSSPVSG